VGGGWWVWYRLVGRYYVTTEDAYVHGDRIPIACQCAGTVVLYNVADTETVRRGAVLLRLNDTRARLALSATDAGLEEAVQSRPGVVCAGPPGRGGLEGGVEPGAPG
jgi:membrane fusion protein (multidrug efflux system)